MLVVNPDGALHGYALEGDEMVALEPVHNPDYVAPVDPVETLAADLAYLMQTLRELGNPPERVMHQDLIDAGNPIDTDRRFVRDFLLDPAAIVFWMTLQMNMGLKILLSSARWSPRSFTEK